MGNADFPLRGFINCSCGKPFTSCWSKGYSAKYAYYLCRNKECDYYGKSLKREKIEGEFETLLQNMTLAKQLITVASAMFKKLWEHRLQHQEARTQALVVQSNKVDHKHNKLLDKIINVETTSALARLEQGIKLLEDEKIVIQEKIANCGRTLRGYSESYRTAIEFLSNPHSLWASGRLENQHAVLKLAFADRLTYVHGEGYRTAKTSLPFKVLDGFLDQNEGMVGSPYIELR